MTVLPERCDIELLVHLTGVSDRRIRSLATEGKIPRAADGLYPCGETLKALYLYWRNRGEGRSSLEDEKLAKAVADREKAELEVKKLKKDVLPRRAVDRAWSFMLQAVQAKWLQLPPKAGLAFPNWTDSRTCEVWQEAQVREILEEFSASPDYDSEEVDEDEELTAQQKARMASEE